MPRAQSQSNKILPVSSFPILCRTSHTSFNLSVITLAATKQRQRVWRSKTNSTTNIIRFRSSDCWQQPDVYHVHDVKTNRFTCLATWLTHFLFHLTIKANTTWTATTPANTSTHFALPRLRSGAQPKFATAWVNESSVEMSLSTSTDKPPGLPDIIFNTLCKCQKAWKCRFSINHTSAKKRWHRRRLYCVRSSWRATCREQNTSHETIRCPGGHFSLMSRTQSTQQELQSFVGRKLRARDDTVHRHNSNQVSAQGVT